MNGERTDAFERLLMSHDTWQADALATRVRERLLRDAAQDLMAATCRRPLNEARIMQAQLRLMLVLFPKRDAPEGA